MPAPALSTDLATLVHQFGAICQMCTAVAAIVIGLITFRYTKRQSALMLINQNNTLANLVNTTVIQSEQARQALAPLQEPIVGSPDDAVLFLYLNYVHNTYRMQQIGAVTTQVWQDTLASCCAMLARLRHDQVQRLLSRGYESKFQAAILARHGAAALPEETSVIATLRPRSRRPGQLSAA